MQARVYLPAYGRFACPDPAYDQDLMNPQSLSLYSYVRNNAATHFDDGGKSDVGVIKPRFQEYQWYFNRRDSGTEDQIAFASDARHSAPQIAWQKPIDMQVDSPIVLTLPRSSNSTSISDSLPQTSQDSQIWVDPPLSQPNPYIAQGAKTIKDIGGLSPFVDGAYLANSINTRDLSGTLSNGVGLMPIVGTTSSTVNVLGDLLWFVGVFGTESIVKPMVINDNRDPQPFDFNGKYNPASDEGAPF